MWSIDLRILTHLAALMLQQVFPSILTLSLCPHLVIPHSQSPVKKAGWLFETIHLEMRMHLKVYCIRNDRNIFSTPSFHNRLEEKRLFLQQ